MQGQDIEVWNRYKSAKEMNNMKKYRIYRKINNADITIKIFVDKEEAVKELSIYRNMKVPVYIEISI